ncbi:MAG: dethiobiotin synthase [Humibacillus sp.]|nr:dethiobiotin synthase [Humibacillus sp.]MDN5777054.1 dethiobiotin synthase [Humibacillus sp.]
MTPHGLPRVIIVTGTDTDVGKTVVTAAITAVLHRAGRRVTAYKPTQTGVEPGEPGDMAEVTRLTGASGLDGVRLHAPMAPRPAASLEGARLPGLAAHVSTIRELAQSHDHVVVEGAGGLLVELTEAGETLADLATALPGSAVVMVVRSGLGTLNHTMLTREALARRQIRSLGIVIGAWTEQPTVIEQTNRAYFDGLAEGVLGAVPWGAPALAPAVFADQSATWLPGLVQRLGTL